MRNLESEVAKLKKEAKDFRQENSLLKEEGRLRKKRVLPMDKESLRRLEAETLDFI